MGRRLTALSTNLSAQDAASTNMIQETLDAGAMLCLSKSSMSLSNDDALEGKNAPTPSDALKRLKAGLHDNGASLGAGCAKSLDGAIASIVEPSSPKRIYGSLLLCVCLV